MGKLKDFKLTHASNALKGQKGKKMLIAFIFLIAVILLIIWWLFIRVEVKDVRTTPETINASYNQLQDNKPPENAKVIEKSIYLSELLQLAVYSKDYEAAKDAFEQRRVLLKDDFPARGYIDLAFIHCHEGDQTAANKALESVKTQSLNDDSLDLQSRESLINEAELIKSGGCGSWLTQLQAE